MVSSIVTSLIHLTNNNAAPAIYLCLRLLLLLFHFCFLEIAIT